MEMFQDSLRPRKPFEQGMATLGYGFLSGLTAQLYSEDASGFTDGRVREKELL